MQLFAACVVKKKLIICLTNPALSLTKQKKHCHEDVADAYLYSHYTGPGIPFWLERT